MISRRIVLHSQFCPSFRQAELLTGPTEGLIVRKRQQSLLQCNFVVSTEVELIM